MRRFGRRSLATGIRTTCPCAPGSAGGIGVPARRGQLQGEFMIKLPLLERLVARFRRPVPARFEGSQHYWAARYAQGGTSGAGSYGRLAEFKAEVLNDFVRENDIRTVVEHGCGDGNQLALAAYPRYLGLDVTTEAVALCRSRFARDATKEFRTLSEYGGERAEVALSLDVIFHLVEDHVSKRTCIGSSRRPSGSSSSIRATTTSRRRKPRPMCGTGASRAGSAARAALADARSHPEPVPASRGAGGLVRRFLHLRASGRASPRDQVRTASSATSA